MGGKKGGENTKKVSGNAKKSEAAAQRQAVVDAAKAAEEDQEWSKGAKSNAKKEAVAAKAAEAAKKKAEKEALLAEEEKSQRAIPKSANAKAAVKKSRGTLDLEELDDPPSESKKTPALNATGIDNALDALSITNDSNATKVERHPERRFKAAYKAYEERRLLEIEQEHPGLRKNQRVEIVRKEFEKSEENPFNQGGNVGYDASKEELAEKKKAVREGVEMRLAER